MERKDLQNLIKEFLEEVKHNNVQQQSASNSQLLKMINDNTVITKEIKEQLQEIRDHQLFKLWEDGKGTIRLLKWVAVPIIAILAFLASLKDGFSIIKRIF